MATSSKDHSEGVPLLSLMHTCKVHSEGCRLRCARTGAYKQQRLMEGCRRDVYRVGMVGLTLRQTLRCLTLMFCFEESYRALN